MSGLVGVVTWRSARSAWLLASPCQITLTWPVASPIGFASSTRRAMSCSTP